MEKSRIFTWLALLAGLTGCVGTPNIRHLDKKYLVPNNLISKTEQQTAEPSPNYPELDVLRRRESQEAAFPYIISSRKTDKKETGMPPILEVLGSAYMGKMIHVIHHELNGHAGIFRPGRNYRFDTAVNFGPTKHTSFNLRTMKNDSLSDDVNFLRGVAMSRLGLTKDEDIAVTMGGIWAAQELYYSIDEAFEGKEDVNSKTAHWIALYSALDFPYHMAEHYLSPSNTSDITQLIDFGYEKDIQRALIADLIGKAPDLYWHAARGLGFDVRRPDFWKFKIPGTELVIEVKPTAYMRPQEGQIGPGVILRLYFENRERDHLFDDYNKSR